MNHIVLKLKEPVTVADVTVAELRIRNKAVSGDLRGISLTKLADLPADDVLKLFGRLSGQPDTVMHALSIPDLGELVKLVPHFLGSGASTGTTNSP